MKDTAVTVTYGGKLSLGPYNSVHLEASVTTSLEPGEDPAQTMTALYETLRAQIRAQASPFRSRVTQVVRDTVLHDPAAGRDALGV